MKEINYANSKTIVLKVDISSKELGENLEYILTEYFGDQVTDVDHGKGLLEDVYMLSPQSAPKIGQSIIQRISAEKEEMSTGF
uniref:DUF4911 domain-containing protein n=1 Tax=Rhabditophanes sp. KR3021 TaxID=114890 RepID=A0AC35UGF8_9BILA